MKLGRTEITSLALAGLAVGSVLLVVGTRHVPTTAERDARAKNLIPVWHLEDVRGIELDAGASKVVLERGADGWTVRAPAPEPADEGAVMKLVNGIGFATPARRLEGADVHAHGLDHPRATLKVTMGKAELVLSLGDRAPAPSGGAYVALDEAGEQRIAAVVPSDVAKLFETRTDDVREHELVPLGVRDAREIVIEHEGQRLRLVHGKALGFRIDGAERASRDACQPLFTTLAHLSATRFLTVRAAEEARGNAALTRVELTPSDKTEPPLELELGGACPSASNEIVAIVRSKPARAACVTEDAMGPLSLERAALLDRYPFAARKDEVEGLVIDEHGKHLDLERRGTAFLLRQPSEAQVPLEAGNRRIEAITRPPAELVEHPDEKALGFQPPSGTVTLHVVGDDGTGAEEKLELGKTAPDGTLYVRRVEDGAVLALGREAARAFGVDSTLLRSTKVLDFALSALSELELTAPEHQLVTRVPSGFALAEPAGFIDDGELTTDAVLALGSLTAVRWVADADDHSFGLEQPTLTARARVDGPDGKAVDHVLVVGRPTPGGYFAEIKGSPGVFVLERSVVDRLSTLLINRADFMADASALARVTLRRGAHDVVLERRDGELVAKKPELPPASVAQALRILGTLRPEAALHTGPAQPSEGLAAPTLVIELEPSPGLGAKRTIRVGATGAFRDQTVRFARLDGVNATFVIAESKLRPLFDLF